jgi:hypothetical protein
VRDLRAHGGSDRLALEYAKEKDDTSWALFVGAGPVQAGMHTEGGKSSLVLVEPAKWFERAAVGVRAREAPGP